MSDFETLSNDGGDLLANDPNASGQPSVSARDLASQAAREALRSVPVPTARPGETFTETVRPGEEGVQADDTLDPLAAPPVLELETVEVTDEDVQALAGYGIELPVPIADIEETARPAYARLAQSAREAAHAADQRVEDAQRQSLEAIEQMKDLRARLSTPEGQHRLLLTLALAQPDTFGAAVQEAQRMAEDPQYKDMVQQRLTADARLEAAQRIERTHHTVEIQRKGQMIEDRTVRLAKSTGVDVEWAKEQVAARIIQNQVRNGKPDISVAEVDEIVTSLAKRVGANRAPTRAPAAQARAAQAPKATAGAAKPPASRTPLVDPQQPAPRAQPGQPIDYGATLRAAVRAASNKARQGGL